MPTKIIDGFVTLDSKVTSLIMSFLKNYDLQTVQKDFVYTIPIFIKLSIYLTVFLIPITVLKFLYPFKKSFHFLLILILFLLAMSLFGIFIGFLQLLYS